MRQFIQIALCCIATAAAGCEGVCDGADCGGGTPGGVNKTLRMEKLSTGQLQYCDDAGKCQSLPNPGNCAVLQITIDSVDGESCEQCFDAEGHVLRDTCEDTSVACTVVTLPEPDCVVCAYINGAIIYSSCVADEPENCVTFGPAGVVDGALPESAGSMPPANACVSSADCPLGLSCIEGLCGIPDQECRVCYDAAGNVILDECGDDCSGRVCPAIECGPGSTYQMLPGSCCGQCVPDVDCSNVDCADASFPNCPDGTQPLRDPSTCCSFYCQPYACDAVFCPAVAIDCPEGFEVSYAYPNCCGACVPVDESRYCYSAADCNEGEICTAGVGDCLCAGPDMKPEVECVMPLPCLGVCRPEDYVCPMISMPAPWGCEGGEWMSAGRDQYGCPLPPVCVCPDASISIEGKCVDPCADTLCFAAPPECEPGEHLETGYPYCCGICVPDSECWITPMVCTRDADCGPATTCVNGGCIPASATDPATSAVPCAAVECEPGMHYEPVGGGCCPVCVPDSIPCASTDDCRAIDENTYCTVDIGECQAPPDCGSEGSDCISLCYGFCAPLTSTNNSGGGSSDPGTPTP